MVPRIIAVLTRFKPDWAVQLQPDALQAACQEAGYTTWRDRLPRLSRRSSSSCGGSCTVTPPAAICRICQAYGAARRPIAKPARNSPVPSFGSC